MSGSGDCGSRESTIRDGRVDTTSECFIPNKSMLFFKNNNSKLSKLTNFFN